MIKWSAKLTIAYNGANYVGWQLQKNGVSVQQKLEEAWHELTGEQIRIIASGRTDSGVHAVKQICSCQTSTELTPSTLIRALNAITPEDICVFDIELAVDGFHAIRDATRKTYHYRIQYDSPRSPFELGTCWYVPQPLNIASMRRAAGKLLGEHDFASFETKGSPRHTTIRNIGRLELRSHEVRTYKFITMEVTANGFLYNMARTIAGTLVAIGQGTRDVDWINTVLAARNRAVAGMTAPPHALFLMDVEYPEGHLKSTPTNPLHNLDIRADNS